MTMENSTTNEGAAPQEPALSVSGKARGTIDLVRGARKYLNRAMVRTRKALSEAEADGGGCSAQDIARIAAALRKAIRYVDCVPREIAASTKEGAGAKNNERAEDAREIDALLGDLQAAVIHIQGEIVKEDEATAKASQVAKDCFHDLRLITATIRIGAICSQERAS
jgi:hypothetical protein